MSHSPGRAPEDADGTVLSMHVHVGKIIDTASCAPVRAVRWCYLEIRTDPGRSGHRQTKRRSSIRRPKVGRWQLPTRFPKWEVQNCERHLFTLTLNGPQGAMDDLVNGINLPQHRGFPSPRPRFDSLEPSQRVGQHPVFRDACHTPNRLCVPKTVTMWYRNILVRCSAL